jgi:hypothetical protein
VRSHLVVLLASLLVAGCFSSPVPEPDPEPSNAPPGAATVRPTFDFSTAIEFEHDHSATEVHGLSYGLELIGHNEMASAARTGANPGGFNEVSIGQNIAVVSNFGPHRVFSVLDVSDPSKPVHLSDWWASDFTTPARAGASSAWGVALFPEDDLVIVSLQAMANPPLMGSQGEQGGGLFLVNLEDPKRPYEESFTAVLDTGALIPVGVHTVRVFDADGKRYAAASTANGATIIYELVGAAPSRSLKEISRVRGMHDTTVQVHPITGQRIVYGAQGGVYLTDISDVANPEIIAFVPNGRDGLSAYHQVVPSDVLIEGRHYTVAATESQEGVPTPYTILDTTDPTEPIVVGQWRLPFTLPGPHSGSPYRYTGHNVDFDRGRLYIGHAHAGVWVVDVSSAQNAADPFAVAFYQPHEDTVHVPFNPFSLTDIPATWSAYRHASGYVYVGDVNTGFYVLEMTEAPSPVEHATVYPHNVR